MLSSNIAKLPIRLRAAAMASARNDIITQPLHYDIEKSKRMNNSETVRKYTSLNSDTPFNLCFLRHGQSTWNRDNRFIGWTDTPLTEDGVLEARVAGQMLARSDMKFDEVHTSLLRRSIRTTNLVLMEIGQEYIPVSLILCYSIDPAPKERELISIPLYFLI